MNKTQWLNKCHVEGYVFSHSLTERVTGENSKNPGTKFIMGDIQVATDANALNIVTVHFTYVTEKYAKSGKDNATYAVLKQIIEEGKTFEVAGLNAMKVRIDGNIEINDFYTKDGELASPKRISGSFCHLANAGMNPEATFEVEMVITNTAMREVENGDDYMNVEGYVFNFRNDILPVSFVMRNADGMKYFEKQDVSTTNPLVTKIWGEIVSSTIENKTEVESAFGAPTVNVTTRTLRSWDIVGASAEPMEFGEVIDFDDIKVALANRANYLAQEKQRHDDYINSRANKQSFTSNTTQSISPTAVADYKF